MLSDDEVRPRFGWAVRILALVILAVVLASYSLRGDDGPEGVVVDNRTTLRIAVFGLGGSESDPTATAFGQVGGLTAMEFGLHGCFPNGMEARDPEGDVIATLPPVDLESETGCEYRWVITPSESYIDTNAAPARSPG